MDDNDRLQSLKLLQALAQMRLREVDGKLFNPRGVNKKNAKELPTFWCWCLCVCVCVCFFFWFFGCVFFVFDEMKSSHWICWGFGGGLKKKAYFGSNPKRNPWAGCLH